MNSNEHEIHCYSSKRRLNAMVRSSSEKMMQQIPEPDQITISTFPRCSQLETPEQIRGFELLRLAFFALKLRKLEQRHELGGDEGGEYLFRCNLLRHAIFQQVLTLQGLDAREQALQLIEACRK
jgi:hypothetical protein